ncbi:SPT16 protein, partial [Bucco capensis]|nr:SPT16 protein [Bucco capensis]
KMAKQINDVGKASSKWESENNENPSVTKEETTLETGNQLIPTYPPCISLQRLKEIEVELVFVDEEDISFEFINSEALRAPHSSSLPVIGECLQTTLCQGSSCYRENNCAAAVEQFTAALKLCNEGWALDDPWKASSEDISSVASFIETKLAMCYLELKMPDHALDHAHRSITLNPAYFRNHLRQAAAFWRLHRYSEAARSAMIADYMYWLAGGTDRDTSKLIKLYWQFMIEEALIEAMYFSVMYTPFSTEVTDDTIKKLDKKSAAKHPVYMKHIYTDPHELHILPKMSDWLSQRPQQYLLTLGFKSKYIGKLFERCLRGKQSIFSGQKASLYTLTKEEAEKYWHEIGKKLMSVMDFVRSTKLTDNCCPCLHGIEKLQYASLLGCMKRDKEQSQVINQAMAELATLPYLQDISEKDVRLLQSLMTDAMKVLGGVQSDDKCVWNKLEKMGPVHDILQEIEDTFLKNKKLRA